MVDADTIEYQAVVEDPQMLSGAWTTPTKTLRRQPFKKIGEGDVLRHHHLRLDSKRTAVGIRPELCPDA